MDPKKAPGPPPTAHNDLMAAWMEGREDRLRGRKPRRCASAAYTRGYNLQASPSLDPPDDESEILDSPDDESKIEGPTTFKPNVDALVVDDVPALIHALRQRLLVDLDESGLPVIACAHMRLARAALDQAASFAELAVYDVRRARAEASR